MARKPRPKASEVMVTTRPMFGQVVSFAEAFPTIEEATVEVEESLHAEPVIRKVCLESKAGGISEFFDCSSRDCYNGGVSIGNVLRHMVSERLTEHETKLTICQGGGSPKRRGHAGGCYHFFKVKARIKYKPDESQSLSCT
jgi:hypothetical protein